MRGYPVAMLVHVLGIVAMFAGFAMQHRAGARLRKATRYEAARPWADLLASTRPMVPSGAVMLLVSGFYLAMPMWPNLRASTIVAIVAVFFIGVASVVFGSRFKDMNDVVLRGDGWLSSTAIKTIGDSLAWGLHAAANGAALGTIWLMTARPALIESVLVVAIPMLVGAVVGARLAHRPTVPGARFQTHGVLM